MCVRRPTRLEWVGFAGFTGAACRVQTGRGSPWCWAHSRATRREGKEGGRRARMALMWGRLASAVPSTTSITTSPSSEGTACRFYYVK